MRKFISLSALFLMAFIAAGCTTRLVDFTILSTKNVDLTRASAFERGETRAEGKDETNIIIFIPTGVPNVKEAVDRAIESVPGAIALVDGVVSYRYFYIPYIFGQEAYVVEGTPLIDPKLAAGKLKSDFVFARMDKNGNLAKLKYVTESEYKNVKKLMVPKK